MVVVWRLESARAARRLAERPARSVAGSIAQGRARRRRGGLAPARGRRARRGRGHDLRKDHHQSRAQADPTSKCRPRVTALVPGLGGAQPPSRVARVAHRRRATTRWSIASGCSTGRNSSCTISTRPPAPWCSARRPGPRHRQAHADRTAAGRRARGPTSRRRPRRQSRHGPAAARTRARPATPPRTSRCRRPVAASGRRATRLARVVGDRDLDRDGLARVGRADDAPTAARPGRPRAGGAEPRTSTS